jgi:hypothetical protein
MRMSIGVPGVALYFEHDQVKPFLAAKYKKLVPAVIRTSHREATVRAEGN